jgi:Trk-type K+ transport system membrane component
MTSPFEFTWRERLTRAIDVALIAVAFLALVSLILDFGGYLGEADTTVLHRLDLAIVIIYFLETFVRVLIARKHLLYIREHALHFIFLGALLASLLVAWGLSTHPGVRRFFTDLNIMSITKLYIVLIQIAMVLRLMKHAIDAQRKLAKTRFKPAHILAGSFALIILLGTIFLYSPHATPGPGHAGLVDALFTATSATCVTGLVVQDTGTYFSTFGQVVMLCLIQVGGLGLMTFSAFFALVIGTGMGIRDRLMMADVLNQATLGQVGKLIFYILGLTFLVEAVGAALLYSAWRGDISTGERVYFSVYHSISAFCNAGFSLFTYNMTAYAGSIRLNAVICVLIVLGGLGFSVHRNLIQSIASTFRRLPLPFSQRRLLEPSVRVKLSLHTKVVLVTTAILIVGGALAIWLLERETGMREMSAREQVLTPIFQSITCRTAGFNTINIAALSSATLLVMMVLMFIGASPGGTGGGVKTSSAAVLFLGIVSSIRNRANIEVFRRRIPRELVVRTSVVVTMALALVVAATVLLCWTERSPRLIAENAPCDVFGFAGPAPVNFKEVPPITLQQALFEVVSAFGTVGLSTGITPTLTSAGKIIIIIMMFLGRIGPLTLVVALGRKRRAFDFEYPEGQVLIG